jgi:hypothetical protein
VLIFIAYLEQHLSQNKCLLTAMIICQWFLFKHYSIHSKICKFKVSISMKWSNPQLCPFYPPKVFLKASRISNYKSKIDEPKIYKQKDLQYAFQIFIWCTYKCTESLGDINICPGGDRKTTSLWGQTQLSNLLRVYFILISLCLNLKRKGKVPACRQP